LECLLRGTEEAGFGSIGSLFERAFEERILYRSIWRCGRRR
jgi:prephenate dehydrogenase